MKRLWIFDFDGTLVDSEQAIKACYFKVGQELVPDRLGFIENMIIGPTLEESSRMILTDKNLHLLEKYKNRFQSLYDNEVVFKTPIYPEVDSTLKELLKKGDKLWIATNKRSNPTNLLIKYYKWDAIFEKILCMNDFPKIKNKSELIKNKFNQIKRYEKVFFVGDTINDGIASNNNNIQFIKTNYGYGKKQDWSKIKIYRDINTFNELLNI